MRQRANTNEIVKPTKRPQPFPLLLGNMEIRDSGSGGPHFSNGESGLHFPLTGSI